MGLPRGKKVQEESSMDLDSANLESNKPNTLDDVADNQEVLHSSERRDIHPDIKERNAHQTLVLVERSHKDLRRYEITSGYRADWAGHHTFCPMEDTRYPFNPHTAVTGPLASSRQSRRNLYHRLLLEFGSGTTSTTSKMYVCRFTL